MALSAATPQSGRRAPDLKSLVEALEPAGVRHVITGSVARSLWIGSADPPPGDLDIAPELSPENLSRLAAPAVASELAAAGASPRGLPSGSHARAG